MASAASRSLELCITNAGSFVREKVLRAALEGAGVRFSALSKATPHMHAFIAFDSAEAREAGAAAISQLRFRERTKPTQPPAPAPAH